MAAFLRPLLRPQALGLGLGLGLGLSIASYHAVRQRTIRLDSSRFSAESYQRNAKTPVVSSSGRLNPGAVRQISSGSIIGLCSGLLVSTFSKSLALLIGLLVVGVQWASSYGINLIPYQRLQKYFSSVDLRSVVQDNVAFKVSFGMTFGMASFMQL